MTFYDLFNKVIMGKEKVINVSPSPSYSGNLIQDWETYKGRIAKSCSRCGKRLDENDKVGGHVKKVPGLSIDLYVVPLCYNCNHFSVTDSYYVSRGVLVRLVDLKRKEKSQ